MISNCIHCGSRIAPGDNFCLGDDCYKAYREANGLPWHTSGLLTKRINPPHDDAVEIKQLTAPKSNRGGQRPGSGRKRANP